MQNRLLNAPDKHCTLYKCTYGIHGPSEQEVGEAEVSVKDLVGVQVEQPLDHLSEYPAS